MELVSTPQHEGPIGGLVPIEPGRDYEAEAREQAKLLSADDDLHKELLDLVETYEKQDESKWRDIKKGWVKARNYADNRQYGYVDNTNNWHDYPKQPGEINYTKNIYRAHLDMIMMELSRGKTELNFSYVAPDSYKGNLITRVAEARYAAHKKRIFTTNKENQENLSLAVNGIAVRYTFFKWNSNSKVPAFGQRDGESQSATVCGECGVPVQGAPCARCGSSETKEISSSVQSRSVASYDSAPSGENDWVSVDPMGLNFYLQATCPAESPYWIWRQAILQDILQSKYKDTGIKEGRSETMMDKAGTDTATPNAQGNISAGQAKTADFIQAWFDYDVYCHRRITKDTRLRNGKVLKAGTTWGEAFPSGLYIAINGKTVLDVWNEDKNQKWTAAPYGERTGTMIGAGSSVALDTQDRKNDAVNLHYANLFSNSFPWTFVNTTLLEGEALPNDPREVANVSQLPDGGRIVGNVVDRLPGMSLTSDAYGLEDKEDQVMQLQLGTFSGNASAMPDVGAMKTATAYMAYRQTQLGRFAMPLATRADCLDREQAYQLFVNDQKHLTPDQWKEVKGDFGAEAVKMFLSCDLRKELLIEVVGESYMPSTKQDKQAEMMAFTEAIKNGLPPDSELAGYAADKFNIPKNLVSFNAVHDATMHDVDKIKQTATMIVSQLQDIPNYDVKNDPKTLQLAQLVVSESGLQVAPSMENHPAIIDALKDWWITDEARESSNLCKASVILYEQQHQLAMATEAASQAELQMIAQAPVMQQQQAMQQQQMEQQNAQQEQQTAAQNEQAEKQQQGEILNKIVEVGQSERDREHTSEQADADRARDIEVARMQSQKVQQAA